MSALLVSRMKQLLECAATELAADDRPLPARQFVAPGAEVAWDDCCDGQLWVRVVRSHPVNPFPTKTTAFAPCPYPQGALLGLGILRCASGNEHLDQGGEPTAADLTGDAEGMLCDMAALHRAVECCHDGITEGDVVTDQWVPLGPSGGCVGGEWTAWHEVTLGCEPESPGDSPGEGESP